LLDGQWDFSLVRTLNGGLRYDKVMPEMLVVGLSYGGNHLDYDALRADDYIPTRAKDFKGVEKGGGAPRFLSWLETTVFPFVEREYRADPAHRILSGSSNGGLFTLYALFEKPDLFESYVAISPAVNWDQRYLFTREKDFHKSHPRLERRLWLSSGSDEWPDYLQAELAFFEQIQSSKYARLTLKVQSIAGERHAGVKPEAYNRAMRFVSEPLLTASFAR
jgi:predicted alpha/beta superfamily hydrolase